MMKYVMFSLDELECIALVFREIFGATNRPLNLQEREISQKIHQILIESNKNNSRSNLDRRAWIEEIHKKCAEEAYDEWIYRMHKMLEREQEEEK
jgi:hypothetical protein